MPYTAAMQRVRYFVRRYWPEFATALVAIVAAFATYQFATSPRLQLVWSVVITLIAMFIILSLRVRERDFHFTPLDRLSDRDDWVGYGIFEYSRMDHCYRITGSDSGYLFTKALNWSDYRLRFRFKILHSCIGVIVRATNLSNLVMLQINQPGISPHFRINGVWKRWEIAETGLAFHEGLRLGEWYDCDVKCDKAAVRVRIAQARKQVCDLAWTVTPAQLNFVIKTDEEGTPTNAIPVPASFEYGMIGFRDHGAELALVKDVLLEKLGN